VEFLHAEEVDEFRRFYREHTGKDLTVNEAIDLIVRLLRVLKIVREVVRKQPPTPPPPPATSSS
jgi:hypothetical protein